jgi:hypothetical protein
MDGQTFHDNEFLLLFVSDAPIYRLFQKSFTTLKKYTNLYRETCILQPKGEGVLHPQERECTCTSCVVALVADVLLESATKTRMQEVQDGNVQSVTTCKKRQKKKPVKQISSGI